MTDQPTGNTRTDYWRYDQATSYLDYEVRWQVSYVDPFGGVVTLSNNDLGTTDILGYGLTQTAGFVTAIERYGLITSIFNSTFTEVLMERFAFERPLLLTDVRQAIQDGSLEYFLLSSWDVIRGSSRSDELSGWNGNDILYGFGGDDTLDGGDGDDTLYGGEGADFHYGDFGDDTFYFDNAGDRAYDSAGGGTDKVVSSVSVLLASNIEILTLIGDANLRGIGNNLANTIEGNAASNRIFGMSGNDVLRGGSGNDVLVGGLGRDVRTGGGGADDFEFNSLSETGLTSTARDQILDFKHLTDDLDLSTIDASRLLSGNNSFVFRGTGSFTNSSSGEVRFTQFNNAGTSKDYTIVYIDNDSDVSTEAQIYLKGLIALSARDFVL